MGRASEKNSRPYAYSAGRSIPIPEDVLKSDAYKVLTDFQSRILINFIGAYCRASNWGKRPVPDGFEFTHTTCGLDVSSKRFYQARRRIVDVGFFDCPPEVQVLRPSAPARFVASVDWKAYEPTAEEESRLRKRGAVRRKRLDRDRQRKTDFLSKLPGRKTERGGRKDVVTVGTERRGNEE